MRKPRKIDYSTEEMIELSDAGYRHIFTKRLESICDLDSIKFGYGLSFSDFKVDEFNLKSDFFFPPEIAEPLSILIKNYDYHPYKRKNGKKEVVTASMISDYTKKVLDDIDNMENVIFKKIIYSYNAYDTSLKLSYWVSPFIREFTHFFINSLQQYGNIGQALSQYTQQLNSFNYNLHRGMVIQKELNVEKENVSIDYLIVKCIKIGLRRSKIIRKLGFPDLDELLNSQKYDKLPEEKRAEIIDSYPSLPIKDKRKVYLYYMLDDSVDDIAYFKKLNSIEEHRELAENWRPHYERIANGDNGVNNEELKNFLLGEISKCDSTVKETQMYKEQLQKWLTELENTGNCSAPFCFESADFIKKREAEYIEHCKKLEGNPNYDSLRSFVDNMIGQSLRYFIDNHDE